MRADYLIWLLEGEVNTDFRLEYFKIRHGLAPPPMTKEDKSRKAKAEAISLEHAFSLVTTVLNENKVQLLWSLLQLQLTRATEGCPIHNCVSFDFVSRSLSSHSMCLPSNTVSVSSLQLG